MTGFQSAGIDCVRERQVYKEVFLDINIAILIRQAIAAISPLRAHYVSVHRRPEIAVDVAVGKRGAPFVIGVGAADVLCGSESRAVVVPFVIAVSFQSRDYYVAAAEVLRGALTVISHVERSAVDIQSQRAEIRPRKINVAVNVDVHHSEFVAVAIDVSVNVGTRNECVALHHHVAVYGYLVVGVHSRPTEYTAPILDVVAVDVEVFCGIYVVLDAVQRVFGLGAVHIFDTGVFPEVHISVDTEFRHADVEDDRLRMVEENVLGKTVLVIRYLPRAVTLQTVSRIYVAGQKRRAGSLRENSSLLGVVPVTYILPAALVLVDKSDQYAGMRVKVAVHRDIAFHGGEHIQLDPVVVKAVSQRHIVHTYGFGVSHKAGILRAGLDVAVNFRSENVIVFAYVRAGIHCYRPVVLAQILSRDRIIGLAAVLVRAVFPELLENTIVNPFVSRRLDAAVVVVHIGRGLRNVHVSVDSVGDYRRNRRLQTERIVENLFKFGGGKIGARDKCTRALAVTVVRGVRLNAELRHFLVCIAHSEFAVTEESVEKSARYQTASVAAARRTHVDTDRGGVYYSRRSRGNLPKILGLKFRKQRSEQRSVGSHHTVKRFYAGTRGVVSLLFAKFGVGVFIGTHCDCGEQSPHNRENGYGN